MNRNYGLLLAITIFSSSSLNFTAERPNPAGIEKLKKDKLLLQTQRKFLYVMLAILAGSTAYTTVGAIKNINLAYSIFKGKELSFSDFVSDFYTGYFPSKLEIVTREKLGLDTSKPWFDNANLEKKEEFYKSMNLNQDENESVGLATVAIPFFPIVSLVAFSLIRYLNNTIREYTYLINQIDIQLNP